MKGLAITVAFVATCLLCSASADELSNECKTNFVGRAVCPPTNGSIAKDALGNLVCGRGDCVMDALGNWKCSVQPGGHAGKDAIGLVRCTGGCESASSSYCETL